MHLSEMKCCQIRMRLVAVWLLCLCVLLVSVANGKENQPQFQLALPEVPAHWQQFSNVDAAMLNSKLARTLEQDWAVVEPKPTDDSNQRREKLLAVLDLNWRTRERIESLWPLRAAIGKTHNEPDARKAAAGYLRTLSAWTEFSGRLRFATQEYLQVTVGSLRYSDISEVIRYANGKGLGIVAKELAYVLIEPPPGDKTPRFDERTRQEMLALMRGSREIDALPAVEELVQWPHTPPELLLQLVNVVRTVGIQQIDSSTSSYLRPDALYASVSAVDVDEIGEAEQSLRRDLLAWLTRIRDSGLEGDAFRWGAVDLCAGDWILQRNPSPYNRFTDLSPGLFTHVGIAAELVDEAGKRRMVIIDLPETGTKIDATDANEFVSKSLHWMVLRHRDEKSAKAMGLVAADLVGRTSEFDLTFNTSLVAQQAGIVQSNVPVRTYCAGFLALCAQEAGLNRESVFPFVEYPINEQCKRNLSGLGLQMTDFVSPSGPLFSPDFQIVGSRQPMYSPGNEIKEAVYDRFACQMAQASFHIHETTTQKLRQQLAAVGSEYSWIRAALAKANNISPEMDLVAAARVATIIENLDAISDACVRNYNDTFILIRHGEVPSNARPDAVDRLTKSLAELRTSHSEWFTDWRLGKMNLRTLRQILVREFAAKGERQVDAMFFD